MSQSALVLCFLLSGAMAGQDIAASQVGSGFSGIDDSGQCVQPCRRSGGRPCAPCLPAIGPASPDWAAAVQETADANKQFGIDIEARARLDPNYRASVAYRDDRKMFNDIRRSVGAMQDIRVAPR